MRGEVHDQLRVHGGIATCENAARKTFGRPSMAKRKQQMFGRFSTGYVEDVRLFTYSTRTRRNNLLNNRF